ncbi:TPA: glycosyltransferase family 2 protein [Streptococcus suis]|nr:glycosyltransferase family 2 protein [Streptococcus suis]
MSDRDLISVVVPVYNVEEYLSDCVNSILKQSYKNFELILVDDGSLDQSGQMCDDFALMDDRINVIHKENGGLSDARNAGIDVAKGQYITFVDSDDVLSYNYLEVLHTFSKRYSAELVQGKLTRNVETLGKDSDRHHYFSNSFDAMINYLSFKDLQGYACNKLYAMRLFKELGLRYPVGKIQEDAWVTYKALFEAKGVVAVDAMTYYYRVNPESIMNGNFNPKRFDILKVPEAIAHYLAERDPETDYKKKLDYFMMRTALKTYNDCLQKNAEKVNLAQLKNTRDTIKNIVPDRQSWEKKYIILTQFIKYFPRIYQFMIKKFR